jgi:HD-like signal output (HDOD) protein
MAARLVQAEPLLAARTVAIANSAAYNRSGNDVTNVRAAVQRVGFRTLGALAAPSSCASWQRDHRSRLRAKADQLWQHSAHVAALAQVIARRVSFVDPETAMFAGIVHEVGGFYLLSRAPSSRPARWRRRRMDRTWRSRDRPRRAAASWACRRR